MNLTLNSWTGFPFNAQSFFLTSRISIVLGQHVLTAFLILLSVIFCASVVLLQTFSDGLTIQAELMTMGAAALLIGYGIHLVNLKDSFSTVKPTGLLQIYDLLYQHTHSSVP